MLYAADYRVGVRSTLFTKNVKSVRAVAQTGLDWLEFKSFASSDYQGSDTLG